MVTTFCNDFRMFSPYIGWYRSSFIYSFGYKLNLFIFVKFIQWSIFLYILFVEPNHVYEKNKSRSYQRTENE